MKMYHKIITGLVAAWTQNVSHYIKVPFIVLVGLAFLLILIQTHSAFLLNIASSVILPSDIFEANYMYNFFCQHSVNTLAYAH